MTVKLMEAKEGLSFYTMQNDVKVSVIFKRSKITNLISIVTLWLGNDYNSLSHSERNIPNIQGGFPE